MQPLSEDLRCSSEEAKELVRFRRQYMQRFDVKFMQFPSTNQLSVWEIQKWIWHFVCEVQTRNPFPQYDIKFLKRLQLELEQAVMNAEEPDILDAFAEAYTALSTNTTVSSNESACNYVWVSYVPPWKACEMYAPEESIDVLERPNVLSAAGFTGHRTWEAALRFGSLARSPQISSQIVGRTVLELGSGTGFLSLLCAKLGAKHVLATDGDVGAVERLTETAQRNQVSCDANTNVDGTIDQVSYQFAAKQYQWGDDIELLATQSRESGRKAAFDTVIAADVVPSLGNDDQMGFFHSPSTQVVVYHMSLESASNLNS
ncbi:MAG: hypothetical protein M1828_001422 [Chrysothrix sp. TS-e1954]|nr:MAG: hypothetical protein M1828_001422 [Chrysothrix sp. TS-e1954]